MHANHNSRPIPKGRAIRSAGSVIQIALLFFGFVAACCSATAQSVFQGTISGTVTDQTGAVVKGATVQIVNEDTHFVTQATSNDKGAYTASFLTPGNYDVKVQAGTFGSQEQTGAVLIAGANKEVDFQLKPSANSQEVTVIANSEMLETGTATINATIDSYLIENTPNTGDNPLFLSTRLPGVYSNQVQGSEKQNWVVQSNGQIAAGNGVSGRGLVNYDGIVDTTYQGNPGGAGGSGFVPPPYATQELCYSLWEQTPFDGRADGEQLARAMELVLQSEHAHFSLVWDGLAAGQRVLLEALASGIPVIATAECGLAPQAGLTLVPSGNIDALIASLRAL